jgi:hypothetical protein
MAPWFWIDNENVDLVFPDDFITSYKKPYGNVSGVPAIRIWTENKIRCDYEKSNVLFDLTKNVWESSSKLQGLVSNKKNKEIYDKAVKEHKKAINHFTEKDSEKYIKHLKLAYNNYQKIKI